MVLSLLGRENQVGLYNMGLVVILGGRIRFRVHRFMSVFVYSFVSSGEHRTWELEK